MADSKISAFLKIAEICIKKRYQEGMKFWAVKLGLPAETSCRLWGNGSDSPRRSTSALRLTKFQIRSSAWVAIESINCLRLK